jgi:hypothetical protein
VRAWGDVCVVADDSVMIHAAVRIQNYVLTDARMGLHHHASHDDCPSADLRRWTDASSMMNEDGIISPLFFGLYLTRRIAPDSYDPSSNALRRDHFSYDRRMPAVAYQVHSIRVTFSAEPSGSQ